MLQKSYWQAYCYNRWQCRQKEWGVVSKVPKCFLFFKRCSIHRFLLQIYNFSAVSFVLFRRNLNFQFNIAQLYPKFIKIKRIDKLFSHINEYYLEKSPYICNCILEKEYKDVLNNEALCSTC